MKFLVIVLGLVAVVAKAAVLPTGSGENRTLPFDPDFELKRLALQNPDLYDGDMAGIDGPL
ncbi:hypothetical protein AVEN_174647-1, partial [Araneus ventricosus]